MLAKGGYYNTNGVDKGLDEEVESEASLFLLMSPEILHLWFVVHNMWKQREVQVSGFGRSSPFSELVYVNVPDFAAK